MWKERLSDIVKEMKLYENLNCGASENELLTIERKMKEVLDANLPREYLKFLKVINGLEFNGFIFYGIDEVLLDNEPSQHINGLIDNNEIWYENTFQRQYVFLGESDISWFVYSIRTQKYYEIDNVSGSVYDEFNELEGLLEKVLADCLV